jgi:hypothetical protein
LQTSFNRPSLMRVKADGAFSSSSRPCTVLQSFKSEIERTLASQFRPLATLMLSDFDERRTEDVQLILLVSFVPKHVENGKAMETKCDKEVGGR